MPFLINCTTDHGQRSPMHQHNAHEIILFTRGQGVMYTQNRQFSFSEGTVIIMPPKTKHGSVSTGETERIYVQGDFRSMFRFEDPVCIFDNAAREGTQLARMILRNRFSHSDFLSSLCVAYAQFLLRNLKIEDKMASSIAQVIQQISERFSDAEFNVTAALHESGYAEDYIRACFRAQTGKTPGEFLTDVRIRHARFLIDIYGDCLSLSHISEQCGFTDYVYFSRKFKQMTGLSPRAYRAQ